jgi:hypothetical protein
MRDGGQDSGDGGTGLVRVAFRRSCLPAVVCVPMLPGCSWSARQRRRIDRRTIAVDVQTYVRQIVEPTINEYVTEPTSIRRAFLSCAVTYHIIDYLTYPKKSAARRQKFRESSDAFAIVDRVAHAFKHVTTGDTNAQHTQPLASGDVISAPPFMVGMPVGLPLRLETVALPHEGVFDLLSTVKLALEFLRTQERGVGQSA